MTHKQKNSGGLQLRYIISKVDGTPVDPSAEYFALRVDMGGDPVHVAACRKAILCYADEIESHNAALAADIRLRYSDSDTGHVDLKAKVEELLEANLAQHDEWNGLMNAYYELDQSHKRLEEMFKAGIRTYVDTNSDGDLVVPYIVPTDVSPNATLLLDNDIELFGVGR